MPSSSKRLTGPMSSAGRILGLDAHGEAAVLLGERVAVAGIAIADFGAGKGDADLVDVARLRMLDAVVAADPSRATRRRQC